MEDARLVTGTVHAEGTVSQGPLPDGRYAVVVAGFDVKRPRSDDARVAVVLAVTGGTYAGTTITYVCRGGLERRAAHAPYPAFARFLEAATGIPCGDDGQRYLGERAMVGQLLEVTLRAGFDGVQRVVGFAPPGVAAGDPGARTRERIAALVRGAGLDAAALRDLIASVSRGRTRSGARLRAAEAHALVARLRGGI